MRKPGCIEPVYFFVNGTDPAHPPGYIMLAPYSDMPAPSGWRKDAVDTLAEVDRLERKLYEQCKLEWEREAEREEQMLVARCSEVRDRLYARMISSHTDPFEKECLRLYMEAKYEKRRKIQQRMLERQAYLYARHFDSGTRRVDSEEFSVEKHEVK